MRKAKSSMHLINGRETITDCQQGRFAITPCRKIPLSIRQLSNIEKHTHRIRKQYRHISSTKYFGDHVKSGDGGKTAILLSDRSEIRLLSNTGTDPLAYRMALLASSGDGIILTQEKNTSFEQYLGNILGLKDFNSICLQQSDGPTEPTAIRCYSDPGIFKEIMDIVQRENGVTLIPFISTGSVWKLAREIGKSTETTAHIAGSPPGLTAKVNDKLWFAEIISGLFGEQSLPPVRTAYTPAGLTLHVHQLAKKWDKLVIKVPDSAGSVGNFPLQSDAVRSLGARTLRDYLVEVLSARKAQDEYPLMVQVWDSDIIASPSAQMWIPSSQDGPPELEGIYDQIIVGERGTFIGATLIQLEKEMEEAFCNQAMQMATLFQSLGYYGRCSFDSVIVRDENQGELLHWIECNGRWGGVSLPMTLLNRVYAGLEKPSFIVTQLSGLDYTAFDFEDALELIGEHLYKLDGQDEGVILTSPNGIEDGNALQLIAVGSSLEKAEWHLKVVQNKLGIT